MRINCFNGLTIHGSKGTLSEKDFISSRCYTLLSYLAVTAGNRATANQLALILWPDESCEIPMKSVRNIAYRLRSLLGYCLLYTSMADPEAQGGGRAPGRERARDGGVSVQTSPRNRRMPEPPVTGKTAEVKSDGQA